MVGILTFATTRAEVAGHFIMGVPNRWPALPLWIDRHFDIHSFPSIRTQTLRLGKKAALQPSHTGADKILCPVIFTFKNYLFKFQTMLNILSILCNLPNLIRMCVTWRVISPNENFTLIYCIYIRFFFCQVKVSVSFMMQILHKS